MTRRKEALDQLLKPILWDWSSSIQARKNLVIARHNAIAQVIPFLTDDEVAQAQDWCKREAHSGLWD